MNHFAIMTDLAGGNCELNIHKSRKYKIRKGIETKQPERSVNSGNVTVKRRIMETFT